LNNEKIRVMLQSIGNTVNSLAIQLNILAEYIEQLIEENDKLRKELEECKNR